MLGIVIVAHGGVAREMKRILEHLTGAQPDVLCVAIEPNDDVEVKRQELADKIIQANQGEGVVIATDMYGGTPSNLALSLMSQGNIEVISGINIPAMVKLVRERKRPLTEAVRVAVEAGCKYMTVASDVVVQTKGE